MSRHYAYKWNSGCTVAKALPGRKHKGELNRAFANWFWLPELVLKLEIKAVRSHEHTTKAKNCPNTLHSHKMKENHNTGMF